MIASVSMTFTFGQTNSCFEEIGADGKVALAKFVGKQVSHGFSRSPVLVTFFNMAVVGGNENAMIAAHRFLVKNPIHIVGHVPVAQHNPISRGIHHLADFTVLEQDVGKMHRLNGLGSVALLQFKFYIFNDFCPLLGIVCFGKTPLFIVPDLLQFRNGHAKFFCDFKQKMAVLFIALHIKAVEAKLVVRTCHCVVLAHP